jgi:phage tail sheath gpL-like
MPAQITFSSIPPNLRIPSTAIEFDNSQAGVNQESQRDLIIAQTIAAQPALPLFMTDYPQASLLFGPNSQLALMVQAYRLADPFGELWCLPLADAGGSTAATGSIAFTGTATAAGVLALYLADVAVPVPVPVGTTAAQLATAAAAAINANLSLPATAAPSTGTVNLTADNKGTLGNSIDLRLNYYGMQQGESTPPGITAVITAMSGGATDPDLSGLDAILGDVDYDFIGLPGYAGATQLNSIQTLMSNQSGRWSWTRANYGHVWTAKMDADATGATNLAFGAGRNDPHVTCVTYEPAPPPPWAVAATWLGAVSPALKADPARPVQTLTLPGLLAPPKSGRYTKSTRQSLLTTGLATMSYNADGTCQIQRSVTTYQKNPAGAADQSYLDAETMLTLMFIARFRVNRFAQKFPRAKLAADGTNFGFQGVTSGETPNIVTPSVMRSELIAQYAELIDLGICQDMDAYKAGLVVQLNSQDASRMDVLDDPILVGGLRVTAILEQFRLIPPSAAA